MPFKANNQLSLKLTNNQRSTQDTREQLDEATAPQHPLRFSIFFDFFDFPAFSPSFTPDIIPNHYSIDELQHFFDLYKSQCLMISDKIMLFFGTQEIKRMLYNNNAISHAKLLEYCGKVFVPRRLLLTSILEKEQKTDILSTFRSRLSHFDRRMVQIQNHKLLIIKPLKPSFIASLLVVFFIQDYTAFQQLYYILLGSPFHDQPLFKIAIEMCFFNLQFRSNSLKKALLRYRRYEQLERRFQRQIEMYVREFRILILDFAGIKLTYKKKLSDQHLEIIDYLIGVLKVSAVFFLILYHRSKLNSSYYGKLF